MRAESPPLRNRQQEHVCLNVDVPSSDRRIALPSSPRTFHRYQINSFREKTFIRQPVIFLDRRRVAVELWHDLSVTCDRKPLHPSLQWKSSLTSNHLSALYYRGLVNSTVRGSFSSLARTR